MSIYKFIFLGLLGTILIVWGNIFVQIYRAMKSTTYQGSPKEHQEASFNVKIDFKWIIFDSTLVDPFIPPFGTIHEKLTQKPMNLKKSLKSQINTIVPPDIVIQGFLSGPNPVAIIQIYGKTELVSTGLQIGELKFISVEDSTIRFIYKGKKFTLDR